MKLDWKDDEEGLSSDAVMPDGRKAHLSHDMCRGVTTAWVEVDGFEGGLHVALDTGISSAFTWRILKELVEELLDWENVEPTDENYQKFMNRRK